MAGGAQLVTPAKTVFILKEYKVKSNKWISNGGISGIGGQNFFPLDFSPWESSSDLAKER